MQKKMGLRLQRCLRVWILAGLGVTATFGGTGCGKADPKRFTPSPASARNALDAALGAWQRGELGADNKVGSSPATEFVDSKRQAKQTLANYEILGSVAGDQNRFSVRLQLENPSQEVETQYVVVGHDPIWVFSEEDYARNQGM